jgi:hypothetical protein
MGIYDSSTIPSLSQAANAGLDPDELLASGDPHGMLAAKVAGVPYVPKRLQLAAPTLDTRNFDPSTKPQLDSSPYRVGTPPSMQLASNPTPPTSPVGATTRQPTTSVPVSEDAMTEALPSTRASSAPTPRSQFSDLARNALQKKMQVLGQAQAIPNAPDVGSLEARRVAAVAGAPNAADAQYQPSVGRRIARGVEGVGLGLAEGGLRGAIAGGIAPQTTGLAGYRDPNSRFAAAQQANTQQVADLDQQLKSAQDQQKDVNERVKNQTEIASQFGSGATQATEAEKANNPDDLKKYQIITAGDGSMFRINPSDPKSAEPILGPDGKQITGKTESRYVQLEGKDGKPHTVEVGPRGETIKDLGPTGEKPPHVSVSTGTWALDEDKDGKPVLFNSKTGETKEAPAGIAKAGTFAKNQAAFDKVNGPVDAAMEYANTYLQNPKHTGSGDEALQEKFFELAKPSVGFRMTQPQIDLLQNSRSWMNSAEAHIRHATTGTWFSDDQRKEIVQTMKDLAAAKKKSGGAQAVPSSQAPAKAGGFSWDDHPLVKP